METTFDLISPVNDKSYCKRTYANDRDINQALVFAVEAQRAWRASSIALRIKILTQCVNQVLEHSEILAEELTWQIGRPISQTPGELRGFAERARYMLSIAEAALANIIPTEKTGFIRYIKREALGVILVIAPWNYPYLTTVNSLIPALVAGNAVLLKPSPQTARCAERLVDIFLSAGLPAGLFQCLHMRPMATQQLIQHPSIDYIAFTGSVAVGHKIVAAASERFIPLGLELGGKDPAYVRADANLADAIENLVDGSFFNAGQSCCAIERIYVANSIYKQFVDGFVDLTKQYRLGNPLDSASNLGPVVNSQAVLRIHRQIAEALQLGATPCIDQKLFNEDLGACYLAPQVFTEVNHDMLIMREESFGPVVGIMPVKDDHQAISLMNDSTYGLSASIWTCDVEQAQKIGDQIATGTVFMNRCDYLDPGLAWTGVKDSGRGITLSALGFEQLTRAKSFHLKVKS